MKNGICYLSNVNTLSPSTSTTPICIFQNHSNLRWIKNSEISSSNIKCLVKAYIPNPDFWICQGKSSRGNVLAGTMHVGNTGSCLTNEGETNIEVQVLCFQTNLAQDTLWNSLHSFDSVSTYANDMVEGIYTLTASSSGCRRMCETLCIYIFKIIFVI